MGENALKKRAFSTALALCLCLSATPFAYARQEPVLPQRDAAEILTRNPAPRADVKVPTQQEAYEAMIALKDKERYQEGAPWTNETHEYRWNGGTQGGIAAIGAGCVAFAYELSDAAFGALPARMYMNGNFQFSDVKVGDILRINGGAHTVIVTQVSGAGVEIAEGNYSVNGSGGKVHWGRTMSKSEVEASYQYITRYPEGYDPDDPSTDDPIEDGAGSVGPIAWTLTRSGTLTLSGNGAMPDGEYPWSRFNDQILNIVIEDGVTHVGSGAFQNSKVIGATIPASVKSIGDSAFRMCPNLISVAIPEGVESIGGSAFQGCTALRSIALPASVEAVGDGAFFQCTGLTRAEFAPSSYPVTLGDDLFSGCWKLTEATLPKKADKLGNGTFTSCIGLSSLTVPEGVTSIGERAFASCGRLKSVWIPSSVTQIGFAAFSSSGVTDIYFGGSQEQWDSVQKLGDTGAAVMNMTIHYDSLRPGPDEPDHVWDSGVVTQPATCTEDGVLTYTCECGETRTEAIPALGHDWGRWAADGHKTHTRTCRRDNGHTETEAHIPGPGATASRPQTCTACGYVLNPATGGGRDDYDDYDDASSYEPPTFRPEVSQPDQGGAVSVSPSSPKQGDTVTITPKPDGGYEVDKITVTSWNGKRVEIKSRRDGSYTFTQPSGRVKIKVTYKPIETRWDNPFTDVSENAWYYEAVRFVQERGLMGGYSDGRFGADDTLSRAQLAQILFAKEGGPAVDYLMDFSDVAGDGWYTEAIRWAASQGIVGGYSDGTFGPDDPITREQLALMFWRYAGSPPASGELAFSDGDEISAFALDAMRWASGNGILSGNGGGRISPQSQATRGQVAQMLQRFIENLEEKA